MWATFKHKNTLQLIPVNDKHEHEISPQCRCKPRRYDVDENGTPMDVPVYIHRAYDARDVIEEAEKLISTEVDNE